MARKWHVPPTVVLRERKVNTTEWTGRDVDHMLALEEYESGLCPGGDHPLSETARPEHEDAYRLGERIRCYYCKANGLADKVLAKDEDSAGVLIAIDLDPEVVALNRRPIPPVPPELLPS